MDIRNVLGAAVLAPILAFGAASTASAALAPGDIIATWGDSFDDTFVEVFSFDIPEAGMYKASVSDREGELDALASPLNIFNPIEFMLFAVSQGSNGGVGSTTIGTTVTGSPTSGSFTFMADAGTYQATFVGLPGSDALVAVTDDSIFGADISAVPVPAAVWLFGSAIVGLIAVGRSRSTSSAAA